jgi:hypothetical protein
MVSDTINFVKINYKSLFSGLFYICTPALLLFGVFTFLFFNNYFNFTLTSFMGASPYTGTSAPEEFIGFLPYLFLFFAGSFLAISFVSTASYAYVKLYKNEEEITTASLWSTSRRYLGKVLGAQLLLFVLLIIAYGICFIPLFLGTIGAFLMLLLFLIFFVGVFHFSIKLTFFQAFIILEDAGIIESFKRSYKFTTGIFWKTFLFMLLIGFIGYFFAYLLQLPGIIFIYFNFIMGIVSGNSDSSFSILLGSALTGLGSAFGCILYSIIFIGICFLYYSVIENRQGTGIKGEIDTIGEKENSD